MIVSGLRRAPSTMRSRSCATDQRAPAPARLGARLPWKRSSAIGPLWQSRQSPTLRLATMARPRAASPGLSGERLGNGIADDSVRHRTLRSIGQGTAGDGRDQGCRQQARTHHVSRRPRSVMVLNQLAA